jgi:septal ring factor EnvC (AmiA/AmiB activator)
MKRFVVCLLLCFLFEPAFSWAKKPNPTACYDFNSPVRVGGGTPMKFNFRIKKKRHKHHKKSPEYSDCMKEVMKNRDEIKKDLKEIDKKIDEIVTRKLKKANKIVQEVDGKVDNLKDRYNRLAKRERKYIDRRSDKEGRQRIRKEWAWSSWCLFF